MSLIEAGTWTCTVIDAVAGEDRGAIVARVNVEITEGPSKGRRVTYEDQFIGKSAYYTALSCQAVGWNSAGGDPMTLAADVAKWKARTGGASTVEIRHIEIKRGKKYDQHIASGATTPLYWDKANSLGRGAKPPLAAPTSGALQDAKDAIKRALADAGGTPPVSDAPPPSDDDIPFAFCGDVSPLARVLR